MDVIAFTASPKDTPEKKKDAGYIVPGTGDPDGSIPSAWYSGLDKKSLHDFLKQDIDLLLVSVPLTKETTHFLSKEEFKVLSQNGKKPAFIANIARGPIIERRSMLRIPNRSLRTASYGAWTMLLSHLTSAAMARLMSTELSRFLSCSWSTNRRARSSSTW
jgi:hypothetical protein